MTKPECRSGTCRAFIGHSSFGFHWSFRFGHWDFALSDPPLQLFRRRADERSVPTRQTRTDVLMRVLLIEDDAQLRQVMRSFLRCLGVEVLAEIPDGKAA